MTANKQKSGSGTSRTRCEKVKYVVSNITAEPVVFLTFLASKIYQLVTQNLYIEKACRVSLELTSATCDAMTQRVKSGYTPQNEIDVQKLTAKMIGIKSLIQGFFPLCLSLFVGSWSDRHSKRKPVILLPVFGEFLSCICLIVNTIFFYQLPLIVTALCDALPMSLLGGWTCLFIGAYSFVGSVSSKENRTMRIAFVTTSLNIGLCLGVSLSGVLYQYVGFIPTYSICAVLVLIALLFGYVLINDVPLIKKDEHIEGKAKIKQNKGVFMDFFDIRYFLSTLKVCFKSTKNNRRNKMIVIMLLGMSCIGTLHGEGTVSYLYTRYKFGWNSLEFSANYLLLSVIHLVSSIVSVGLFSKWLKWEDETLGMIAVVSSIAGNLIFAFATKAPYFVAGAFVDCFSSTAHIAVRSMIPKIIPAHELGQAYSVSGIFEAITPMTFCPIYTFVYKITIEIFPGTFYLFSAGIKVIAFFMFGYLYLENNKDKKPKDDNVESFNQVDNIAMDPVEC